MTEVKTSSCNAWDKPKTVTLGPKERGRRHCKTYRCFYIFPRQSGENLPDFFSSLSVHWLHMQENEVRAGLKGGGCDIWHLHNLRSFGNVISETDLFSVYLSPVELENFPVQMKNPWSVRHLLSTRRRGCRTRVKKRLYLCIWLTYYFTITVYESLKDSLRFTFRQEINSTRT